MTEHITRRPIPEQLERFAERLDRHPAAVGDDITLLATAQALRTIADELWDGSFPLALRLLDARVDDEPCSWDDYNTCQSHANIDGKCWNELALRVLQRNPLDGAEAGWSGKATTAVAGADDGEMTTRDLALALATEVQVARIRAGHTVASLSMVDDEVVGTAQRFVTYLRTGE